MWQWCGEGGAGLHSPYLVCVLCVQNIDHCQRLLQDPSTDEWRRPRLEREVQYAKNRLQQHNASIAEDEARILELVRERSAISKQGEPLGCHANGCRVWLSRCHVTMVTRLFLFILLVAMVFGC